MTFRALDLRSFENNLSHVILSPAERIQCSHARDKPMILLTPTRRSSIEQHEPLVHTRSTVFVVQRARQWEPYHWALHWASSTGRTLCVRHCSQGVLVAQWFQPQTCVKEFVDSAIPVWDADVLFGRSFLRCQTNIASFPFVLSISFPKDPFWSKPLIYDLICFAD